MFAALISGHDDLADWLFLIAAVLFVLVALIAVTKSRDPSRGALLPVGLALVAVAFLVL